MPSFSASASGANSAVYLLAPTEAAVSDFSGAPSRIKAVLDKVYTDAGADTALEQVISALAANGATINVFNNSGAAAANPYFTCASGFKPALNFGAVPAGGNGYVRISFAYSASR